MKIEHTTYDQAHGGPSTRRPSAPSTSPDMTTSINSRPRRHSEKKALPADDERPITMWPRTDASPPDRLPEMTTFLMLERHLEKGAREKERATLKVHFSDARSPKSKPATRKPIFKSSQAPPPLRRKPNFSHTLRECLGSPKSPSEKKGREQEIDELTRVHIFRSRIREGKLEKVVPPPRSRNPALEPPSPRASQIKKSSWAPSKFGEFIDRGADLLDETRKDLAEAPIKELQALKNRQQQNATELSGEGTDPWSQPPPTVCRLCRKPGVRGIRGLCNDCETDFIRPKTNRYEFSSSLDRDEDKIKPTPPLKDLRLLIAKIPKTTKEAGARSKSVSHPSQGKRECQKPESSVKAKLKTTGTDSYPRIISPTKRQSSHEEILDEGSDDEKYRSWQTPEMRAEYERTKSLFKRWSDCYETDDFESFEKEHGTVLPVNRERTRPGTGTSRDSGFYEFYDDLLSENGAKSTSSRRAWRR